MPWQQRGDRRRLRLEEGSGGGSRGGGQGREVGERGEGGDEARHLTRSPPEIVRAQTGGVCRATKQVLHRVLKPSTAGAQWRLSGVYCVEVTI